jgi:membrane-bound metal-dependent hydrolase YbcI (DUF457 family)
MSASFLCLCAADHLENLFIIRLRRMCGDAARGQRFDPAYLHHREVDVSIYFFFYLCALTILKTYL